MSHAGFVHLRVHSAYSLAEGAIKTGKLISLCKEHDMPAVAVTDSGNLFGALEFSMAAVKSGIQPIIGCQVNIARPDQDSCTSATPPDPDQIVLLVQNEQGYLNLSRLVSEAFLKTDGALKPRIGWDLLEECSDGLICLTGGPKGTLGRLIAENRMEDAADILDRLQKAFGDRLYIELLRHGTLDETSIEDQLLDFAYDRDIPIVATNNGYFPDRAMHEAHDALLCIADGAYVIEDNRRKATPEHYFKSPDEMKELFSDLPEAIENTVVIARRCSWLLQPIDPILPPFDTEGGLTEIDALKKEAREGLDWRLEKYVFTKDMDEAAREKLRAEYAERLEYELGTLIDMGFAGYFLIVADFIQWAKDNRIPVGPGRGSGAGSLVAWAMRITDLDPIRFNLLFERFLNPERVSMPDFDIDFCQERRDEVIKYVQDRYGHDRVAQIITFGKLQARAVVRDVGRVLQMPYGQVDRIAKLIPSNPANPVSLQEALDTEPDLRAARDDDENVGRLIDTALKLEGLYRHASTHAAGVVIGDRPLEQLVPLYRDPRSTMPVTQFNMKYVEQAGLVKFDFLGLKTLTVIQTAIDLIKETEGIELDPLEFPLDDEKTFRMLARGECSAVFQLESAGMRDLCKQMKISRFEEIIALVALYRPGPMENIPKYLACLNGEEEQDYMHPSLEPILKETYGVMIYQEQVMQVAQKLAGFSLGGADLLRRAMGKKIKSEMDAQRELFVEGAVKNDVDADQAGLIFDQVAKFAGYGFNKAHSAAYAFVAYQTAWLKANYPVEFMAATMTLDLQNTEKLAMLRQEVQRMKIDLLPPDINASGAHFTVEQGDDGSKSIRYALGALKGVGEQAMKAVEAERGENGPYEDLYDFAGRLDPKTLNKRQLESMAAAGAFDLLNDHRAQVHAAAETLMKYATAMANEKDSGQVSLFDGDMAAIDKPAFPLVEDWESMERLKYEADAVGFYLSAHPLDSMEPQLERLGVVPLNKVASKLTSGPGSRVKMAGIVLRKQERTSAKGNRFAFVQLSDSSGVYEVTMFSEVLAAARDYLEAGNAVMLSVDADNRGEGELRFLAQHIEPLERAVEHATTKIEISINDVEAVDPVRTLMEGQVQGRIRVHIVVDTGDGKEVDLRIPGSWSMNKDGVKSLKSITGVTDVREM